MIKLLSVLLTIPVLLVSVVVFMLILISNKLLEKVPVKETDHFVDSDYLSYCVIPASV